MLKRPRTHNPFKEYQKRRIEANTAKIQSAIDTLRNLRAPITYGAVARLTAMTLSGIRKNSHYVMLVETAKAQARPQIQHSATPDQENPGTLDDALALLRILRAKNQSLARKVNLQARVFKRYNLHWSEGEFVATPTEEATPQPAWQQVELLRRIIEIILDDKVYTLTAQGIISPLNGMPIVSRSLLRAANLQEYEEGHQ